MTLKLVRSRDTSRPENQAFVAERHLDVRASDGVRLAVNISGNPAGPTVLLVHGYPDDCQVWDGICAHLARQYRVVTFDVRGCGASTVPGHQRGFRLAQLANDIFTVIDAVSPDQPVHLVGHDWGAIQSWEAATDPRATRQLASLFVISGPCLDHVGYWMRDLVESRALKAFIRQASKSWYIAAFHLPLLAPGLWQLGLDRAWPGILKRTENVHHSAHGDQRSNGVNGINLYRANILERLAEPRERFCEIPVHLLIATEDRFVGPDMMASAEPWCTRLSRSEVAASHWVPLSQPGLVSERIHAHVLASNNGGATAIGKRASGG